MLLKLMVIHYLQPPTMYSLFSSNTPAMVAEDNNLESGTYAENINIIKQFYMNYLNF